MVKHVSEIKAAHMMTMGTNEVTTIAAKLLETLHNSTQQPVHAQGTYNNNARISQ